MKLELKNVSTIPLNITISPVQQRHKYTRISIPSNNSFTSNADSGTKYVSVTKEHSSKPFWEGIIPTHISEPIIINAYDHLLTYKGRILTNLITNPSSFNLTSYITLLIIITLIIAGSWMYYKKSSLRVHTKT